MLRFSKLVLKLKVCYKYVAITMEKMLLNFKTR